MIEMPFVSYGTKTLTQGQLQSIDTPEWFSGQDLVLTLSGWHYVRQYTEKFPGTTDELLNNIYVDDVQLGGNHSDQSIKLKKRPQRLWTKEVFISQSNLPALEERQRQVPRKILTQLAKRKCQGR